MSAKQQLAEAVAALPETASLQEAFARLYQAFKEKLRREEGSRRSGEWLGIEKTPGVVGGDACIAGTRIPVWTLSSCRRSGLSDAAILEEYPHLSPIDLLNAWSYAEAHADEIERAIRENDEA